MAKSLFQLLIHEIQMKTVYVALHSKDYRIAINCICQSIDFESLYDSFNCIEDTPAFISITEKSEFISSHQNEFIFWTERSSQVLQHIKRDDHGDYEPVLIDV